MKKVFVLLFILLLSGMASLSAAAEEGSAAELYRRQYESSGAGELADLLPGQTENAMDRLEIDPADPASLSKLEPKNVFAVIWEFLADGAKTPLSVTAALVGVLLLFASAGNLMGEAPGSAFAVFVCFGAALVLLRPVYEAIGGVESAIRGISVFMLSFVPVFAGIMLSSGAVSSAGGFSALLLGAAESMAQFVSFGFVPMIGGCMCLGICGGLSPVPGIARIGEFLKKTAIWVMGLATTLFLGVLSIQTSIQAAADNLGLRTSKAVLGGAIPVMGPAIAETLGTAKSCLSLLRSGVGIYGVLAVVLMALPLLSELILWRAGLWLCAGVGEVFGMKEACALFRSVDFCLAILIGALVFVALLFIISLTVAIRAGGG